MEMKDRFPVRRSPRLFGYDYRTAGAYFVTICTAGRRNLFGSVRNDRVRLNQLGEIVVRELQRITTRRRSVVIDAFVVMPNHVHAIVVLRSDDRPPGLARESVQVGGHPAGAADLDGDPRSLAAELLR